MENVWKLPPAVREGIQLARSGSGGTINACDSDRGQSSEKKWFFFEHAWLQIENADSTGLFKS